MNYFFSQTKKGSKSLQNDDCFFINDYVANNNSYKLQSKINEFIIGVSDGLGSSENGGFAAKYLFEQISKHKKQLTNAHILNIISHVHTYLGKTFDYKASTVFTIVHAYNEFITVYHLGDTRAYKLTKRNFIQLTNDHTYVQQLIDTGTIGDNMRYKHPKKHIVTQSLGGKNEIHIDTYKNVFEPGEKLLLTSDGIHDYLTKQEIETILRQSVNIEKNISTLITKAIDNGSNDDLTAIAVRYT